MKRRILLTRRLPPAVETLAAREFDVVINADDHPMTESEIVERAADVDGILVTSADRITRELIMALPARCKVISTFSNGTEHIDVKAARERGIRVAHAPHGTSVSTAEMGMLLILAAARRAREGDHFVRSGQWNNWSSTRFLGTTLEGKRLAILGMGRIGQALAKRARAFDMEIHYHNRRRLPPHEEQGATYHSSLGSMAPLTDVLALTVPATAANRHMVSADLLAQLPKGAIVVNISRGSLVKDDDLLAALRSGQIAAAGLDVFEGEPNINCAYRQMDNVFLTPHMGASTVESRHRVGADAIENIASALSGSGPLTEVGDPIEWLRPYTKSKTYRAGDVLFSKGALATDATYIVSGIVELSEIGKSVGEGTIIGELGLFSRSNRRTSTAVCKTEVQAATIDKDQFNLLFRQNPDFATYILRLLVNRLQENVEEAQANNDVRA